MNKIISLKRGIFSALALTAFAMCFLTLPASWTTSAAGTVTGRVFKDFNGNGVYETAGGVLTPAVDTGVSGVTVSIYDSSGTLRGSAATQADGTYSLAATGTGPYRVEFTGLPSGFYPSAHSTDSVSGGTAIDSGSTTQFIADGNTGEVNLAVNYPADYSQNSPNISVTTFRNGTNSANTTDAGIFTFPWSAGGATAVNTIKTTLNQVGALWGNAYQRTAKRGFFTAVARRHTGFGPQGIGGVYVYDFAANNLAGSFTLQNVTPANGGAAINLGSINRTEVTGAISTGAAGDYQLSRDKTQPNRDLESLAKIGKVSFGDAEFEESGKYLWVANLNQVALIRVDASLPIANMAASANQYAVTSGAGSATAIGGAPVCTNGVFRIWGLKFYRGKGYVGGVCTAESASGTTADLRGYVLSFDPNILSGGFTTEVNFPLNYNREDRYGNETTNDHYLRAPWQPWRDTWGQITATGNSSRPVISTMDFTENGSMVISLLDRYSFQIGSGNYVAVSGSTTLHVDAAGGDLLQVCKSGTSWIMEGQAGCAVGDTIAPGSLAKTNDGPSNLGEFYWEDNYWIDDPQYIGHLENSLGSSLVFPGTNQVAATAFDPIYKNGTTQYYDRSGVIWYNNRTGKRDVSRSGSGYSALDDTTAGVGGFAKTGALGDMELLADVAPIEIGNRIWNDADGDGVQDPGEAGIAGVTVHLYNAAGNVIATAVTDANGEYYFSSATGTSNGSGIYGLNLQPNTNYSIRMDNPADFSPGGVLNGIFLTRSDTATQAGNADSSDSDAHLTANPLGSPAGNFPVISVTTGASGQNDHTLDAGFAPTAPTAAASDIGGRVLDAKWRGISAASVTLTTQTGEQTTILTDETGYFRFTDVPGGSLATVSVAAKGYKFNQPSQTLSVNEDTDDIYFFGSASRTNFGLSLTSKDGKSLK